ncbi:MarR family winged helix-turn-helix transcriptional regulator [Parahaliea mediterranea]|uniref:MarR family winged helix-turn-helix transcriptional regulator n=1 Tax=Parahaliea mediterranea TaxID=651086 RepID=UPI0013003C5B|nr:winged helix DNA-binding protein [Parahaliea mediterranea]
MTQQALDRARADNLGHRLVALAGDFSERILARYRAQGYDTIRPVHGALLRNLELEGTRLTTLAARAGITHRAMAKIVDDVAGLGFVARRPDPDDRRASRVHFTARGIRLLRDSSDIIEHIYAGYSALVGAAPLEQLENRLYHFLQGLDIEVIHSGQQALHPVRPENLRDASGAYLSHNLGRYLQLAGQDYHRRCARAMEARGHPGIRFDHLALLTHLRLDGMNLSELAEGAGISLQAMGKQVRAVHRMGYISLREGAADRRVREVRFSPRGHAFLDDLLATFDELDAFYAAQAGPRRLQWLQASLARLIGALGLAVPARSF